MVHIQKIDGDHVSSGPGGQGGEIRKNLKIQTIKREANFINNIDNRICLTL